VGLTCNWSAISFEPRQMLPLFTWARN